MEQTMTMLCEMAEVTGENEVEYTFSPDDEDPHVWGEMVTATAAPGTYFVGRRYAITFDERLEPPKPRMTRVFIECFDGEAA